MLAARELHWSHDGKKILYSSVTDSASSFSDIFIMNADGTGVTQLTQNYRAGQICLH
jgi:Tol biopolymer transport system component